MVDKATATTVFKRVISDTLNDFFDKYGFDLTAWELHIEEMDGRSRKTIKNCLLYTSLKKYISFFCWQDYHIAIK